MNNFSNKLGIQYVENKEAVYPSILEGKRGVNIKFKYHKKIRNIEITNENIENAKKGKYVTISRFYNPIDDRAPENVLSIMCLNKKMYLMYWGNTCSKFHEFNETETNYDLFKFQNPKTLFFEEEKMENELNADLHKN